MLASMLCPAGGHHDTVRTLSFAYLAGEYDEWWNNASDRELYTMTVQSLQPFRKGVRNESNSEARSKGPNMVKVAQGLPYPAFDDTAKPDGEFECLATLSARIEHDTISQPSNVVHFHILA